jgi:membrane protein DedA with SNARE-associated domain
MIDLVIHAGPLASLSGPIVDFCVNVIDDTGLAGVFLLMTLHSVCVPLPSEAVLLFAGFNVSDGHQSFIGVFLAAMAGQIVGSWMAYAIGYYGRTELLEKNRLIHVSSQSLTSIDRWFDRHGDAAVCWFRLLPVVRPLISIPAGVAEMPLWRFTWLTALGSIPWIVGFTLLGDAVGHNWSKWRDHLQYLDYAAIALIVGALVYLVVRRWRGGGGGDGQREPEREPASVAGS